LHYSSIFLYYMILAIQMPDDSLKHVLPPLDRLKVFEASARLLSFSQAARELCITKGAASYQIRMLEEELDTRLFNRSVRQVLLTDAGQLLFLTVQQVFAELGGGLAKLKRTDNRDVRIGATTYVAARWLSPRIASFTKRFPQISIVFHHAVNTDEFSLDDVDVAIQWGKCKGEESKDRLKELPMSLYPVASPGLVEKFGCHNDSLDPQAVLLCEDRSQDLWGEWAGSDALPNQKLVVSDANVRVQLAIDGQGLILADDMMRSEIDSRLLIAPFERCLNGYGYILRSDPQQKANRATIAFRDWLLEEMSS